MFLIERHRLQGEAMKSPTLFYVNNRRWVLLNYPDQRISAKSRHDLRQVPRLSFERMHNGLRENGGGIETVKTIDGTD